MPRAVWHRLNRPFELAELRIVKERLRKGRAKGLDGVPMECFLGMREPNMPRSGGMCSALDDVVLRLFNGIWASGRYPKAWRIAALVPLLKGVDLDKANMSNYRGFALLSALSKMFATLVERRLIEYQWAMEHAN